MTIPMRPFGDLISKICPLLEAIYEALKYRTIHSESRYLMADEIPYTIAYSIKNKSGKSYPGYIWAYLDPIGNSVFFEYQLGRGNMQASMMLEDFKGHLHTDAYSVYNRYDTKKGVTLVNSNSHARQKFINARTSDARRANHALKLYDKLYETEFYCLVRNMSFNERQEARQNTSAPVFNELSIWVKEQISNPAILQSPIGNALTYFSKREEQLGLFMQNGKLFIDTDPIENILRRLALGRKYYSSQESHIDAQKAAILYTLLINCELNNVDPYNWLTYVITGRRIFSTDCIAELLPQNWKTSHFNRKKTG
jgi:hypothetical protein